MISPCSASTPFTILELPLVSFARQILPQHSHSANIAELKSIYAVFLEAVERDLRFYAHLQLNKEALRGLSQEQAYLIDQSYPLLRSLSFHDLQDYLLYITELRGFFTHFGNNKVAVPNAVSLRLLDSLHFPIAATVEGKITLFGALAVLVPLSSAANIGEVTGMFFHHRACLGLDVKALAPYRGKLAEILSSPIQYYPLSRPWTSSGDPKAGFYASFAQTFREFLTVFFLGTECYCLAQITATYPRDQWRGYLYGNTIELMAPIHYLEGEDDLKNDILVLRNAVFHGFYLEEDKLPVPHGLPLRVASTYEVLSRWRAALDDPKDIASFDQRLLPLTQALLNSFYLSGIEANLKLQLTSLLQAEKMPTRAEKATRFYENLRDVRLPGAEATLFALWDSLRGQAADFYFDHNKFTHPGAPSDIFFKSPFGFAHYHSDSFLTLGGLATQSHDLYLLTFPEDLKLPLASVSDQAGHHFVPGTLERTSPFIQTLEMVAAA